MAVDETVSSPTAVELTSKTGDDSDLSIACTLQPPDIQNRLDAWQAALAPVVARELIDTGVRLVLPSSTSLPLLAELAAAEQECCTFFRFAITVDSRGIALEVTAPAHAINLVYSVFGRPE
jgi:hypothetical protein